MITFKQPFVPLIACPFNRWRRKTIFTLNVFLPTLYSWSLCAYLAPPHIDEYLTNAGETMLTRFVKCFISFPRCSNNRLYILINHPHCLQLFTSSDFYAISVNPYYRLSTYHNTAAMLKSIKRKRVQSPIGGISRIASFKQHTTKQQCTLWGNTCHRVQKVKWKAVSAENGKRGKGLMKRLWAIIQLNN